MKTYVGHGSGCWFLWGSGHRVCHLDRKILSPTEMILSLQVRGCPGFSLIDINSDRGNPINREELEQLRTCTGDITSTGDEMVVI